MSNDWHEHNGGPQPVADDVWVAVRPLYVPFCGPAGAFEWEGEDCVKWRVLNQHLIDAARLEGIRLGLEAAAEKSTEWQIRPSTRFVDDVIRALDPATIAKEADND